MSDADITRSVDGTKGRYSVTVDGQVGKLTYSIASPTLIIADHTGVPDALRGKGVGKQLVERMVDDARSQGVKITPLCPFVNAQRRQHPEWSDVFAV